MRIFISADFEGASGVVVPAHAIPEKGPEFQRFRQLWMDDINAAIEGAIQGGASEFLVNEAHWSMVHIIPDQLHANAQYISGFVKENIQMSGLDESFQGAFLLYHAGAGNRGVLSHTWVPKEVHEIRVNGRRVGETFLNAALAGYYRVPIALVVGDDAVCEEASADLPSVVTVETKKSIDRFTARCLKPSEAQQRIKRGAGRAVELLKQGAIKPFSPPARARFEIEFSEVSAATYCTFIPGVQRVDPRTIAFELEDYKTAYNLAVLCVLTPYLPYARDDIY